MDSDSEQELEDFEDVEMVHESEDEQEQEQERQQSKGDSLFKAPTSSEMNVSKESLLFKSNLFKLQITELVAQVSLKGGKANKTMMKTLHHLKAQFEGMTKVAEQPLLNCIKDLGRINIPIDIPKTLNVKFGFAPPERVAVVGSFLLETNVKHIEGGHTIDVGLAMPESLFQEKDFTNHRYFYKRAYYLAVVAHQLQSKYPGMYTMEWALFQNDFRKPVLILHSTPANPTNFSKKGYRIQVLPFLSPKFFARARLAPGRNNVRSTTNTAANVPTPHYNAAVVADSYMQQHVNLIHSHILEAPALRDAVILFKVWINQRALASRVGFTFSGFLVSMIMGWLLRVDPKAGFKKLGKGFSSYQMFKVTMHLLAAHDFAKKPLFLTDSAGPITQVDFSAEAFLEQYECAIVDPTGTINLAASMSASGLAELQYEAKLALRFLSDDAHNKEDRFPDLFLTRVDRMWVKYDNVFRIPVLKATDLAAFTAADRGDLGSLETWVCRELYRVIKGGTGARTRCIAAMTGGNHKWELGAAAPSSLLASDITIGLVLDPEHSLELVEHGPDAQDAAAVLTFKEIWGPKSEMRRFQDGSIQESVLFDGDGTLEHRGLIVARMCAYLISRHFHVGEDDEVTYWAGLGNKFLKSVGNPPTVKSFQSVMDAFQALSKELKTLDLPLSIYRITGRSDELAYCSAFIPQPIEATQLASRAAPPEFIIEFESSGKWPDDIQAIETMKRAFYIKIVGLLDAGESGTQTSVMIGEGGEGFLSFCTASGHYFKAKIHHARSGYLVAQSLKSKTLEPNVRTNLLRFENSFKTTNIHKPTHYNLIGQLCLRNQFLGPTIRLMKRWLSSHMLLSSPGIAPEIVEIICVRIYTVPSAFGPPSSGWTGFVRALELLQSWKWTQEPLIVELEEGMLTPSILEHITKSFDALAQAGVGHLSMFVASEMDPDSVWWGCLDMSVKVMQRITMLAGTCLGHIKQQLLHGNGNDISQLFITPSVGYHAIIHLDPSKLLKYFDSVTYSSDAAAVKTSKFKNVMDSNDKQLFQLSLIDPLQMYILELEERFGDLAMFFKDVYGGDKVALVWKAGMLTETTWRVNMAYNAMPTDQVEKGKGVIGPNKMAMLAEMQRLGEGLVLGISI